MTKNGYSDRPRTPDRFKTSWLTSCVASINPEVQGLIFRFSNLLLFFLRDFMYKCECCAIRTATYNEYFYSKLIAFIGSAF